MDREISRSSGPDGNQSSSSDKSKDVPMDAGTEDHATQKQPSKIKKLWNKTGLDVPTLLLMVKAAIPPTIATAMYQSKAVAAQYTTLGYLVSIMSILGFAIMPRAKFIQTMLINVFAICLGVSVGLFALWTGIKARQNTTPPGTPLQAQGYNAAASTVMGVWLFLQIYLTNALRSHRPQLQIPCIIYSIFAIVTSAYGPLMPTMDMAISFEKRLLETFLTGFGIATGVSLFIFPVTTRKVCFVDFTHYMKSIQGVLRAQTTYMHSLEHHEIFGPMKTDHDSSSERGVKVDPKTTIKSGSSKEKPENDSDGKALQGAVRGLLAVHAKLNGDLAFGKREVAYGKLGASDMQELFRRLRKIMLPLIGLTSLVDIFERIASAFGWNHPEDDEDALFEKERATHEWQNIIKALHEPFQEITDSMVKGLQHVLYQLQFEAPPKRSKEDVEAKGEDVQPGDDGFAAYLEERITTFYKEREITLAAWCEKKGISVSTQKFDEAMHQDPVDKDDGNERSHGRYVEGGTLHRSQRQLFLLLFLEYLMWSASKAILNLVSFADDRVKQGRLNKKRLIVPPMKTLRKWVSATFQTEDSSNNDHLIMDGDGSTQYTDLGDAFYARRDPEHLPPQTTYERLSNYLRILPHALKSPHSVFGLRAAAATLSIGVVAFMKQTYTFFIQQRLVWAMIMVAFSMSRTSGQSAMNFISRVFGTAVAMVASYIIWYIVDGHTAGVIVFMFIWITICFYIPLKMPQYTVVGIISAVTVVLIIGYELEVEVIGVKNATSNGQPAYPIYTLAPYRLATVAGGLAVAYIWTIFPFPITENYNMRQNLGGAIYLLANYYSIIHETVKMRVEGREGDPNDKNSPTRRLEKARNEVFAKTTAMMQDLRMSSAFSKWQIQVGGKFPKETYDQIITLTSKILNYVALLGFASETFSDANNDDPAKNSWLSDFRKLMSSITTTTNEVTSLLLLLSSSLSNGQPLPPFLKAPNPYQLLSKMENLDKDILSVKHISEPGYSAFAVLQVATRTVVADLELLMCEVRKLVGELDFSFHTISTSDHRNEEGAALEVKEDVKQKAKTKVHGKKNQ